MQGTDFFLQHNMWEMERDDREAHGLALGDLGELLGLREPQLFIRELERGVFLGGLQLKG